MELDKEENLFLPVMEQFYTIQGEGNNTGRASWFIRLGGCDVGCTWCDVKESWDMEAHPSVSISELVKNAVSSGTNAVVITGGEPAMHDLSVLTKKLKEKGLVVWIETSGTHELSGEFDWVCLSPKKFKPAIDSIYKKADELKIVIANRNDFKWAESHREKVSKNCKVYLQTEWSRRDKLTPKIVDYVKENPNWQISIQTHKYISIP